VISKFCEKAGANCILKFADGDRAALIAASLDPRHHHLKYLSKSEEGLCAEALHSAFTALKLKQGDALSDEEEEPLPKRPKKGEEPEFDFDNSQQAGKLRAKAASAKDELTRFAALPEQPAGTNPLEWWKLHGSMFPTLSTLARRYLAIPASSASSERLFSRLKLTATPARRNMSPDTLSMLLFVEAHRNDVFAKEG
jgi:hypothetical protein